MQAVHHSDSLWGFILLYLFGELITGAFAVQLRGGNTALLSHAGNRFAFKASLCELTENKSRQRCSALCNTQ